MALIDLTNVNPWAQELDAQRRSNAIRQQAFSSAFDSIQAGLARSAARREALEAQNMAFRDQEYALINRATDNLVQAGTNSKVTDVQLQSTGQAIKKEYYDAVKAYQDSDKGDEARQAFEQAKQKALGSARTISGALDKLTAATTTFENAWNTGGISDAMNPGVRQFMIDLVNPETDPQQFQIVTDPETGRLKYQGETTGGHPVDFFLDDIANGDNVFAPIPKADMPKIVQNLTQGLKADMVQERLENGAIVSKTNWDSLGTQLDARMDQLLTEEGNFRAIAAGEGFGWDAFNAVKNGEVWTDPEGNEYATIDDIKAELKQDLFDKIEMIMPHEEVLVAPPQQGLTLAQQEQRKVALETQASINESVGKAAQTALSTGGKDIDYFRDNLIGRVPNVDEITMKDGKLVLVSGFGKKAQVVSAFDLNKTGDLQRLTELFGGNRDYASQASLFESNQF